MRQVEGKNCGKLLMLVGITGDLRERGVGN